MGLAFGDMRPYDIINGLRAAHWCSERLCVSQIKGYTEQQSEPVFSYKLYRPTIGLYRSLRIGRDGHLDQSISTNPKLTIYRNLYENTGLIQKYSGLKEFSLQQKKDDKRSAVVFFQD